jgi:hypothetical protein
MSERRDGKEPGASWMSPCDGDASARVWVDCMGACLDGAEREELRSVFAWLAN